MKLKKFEIIILLSFIICCVVCLWISPFNDSCEGISEKTVRLHILANSDDPKDQQIKLDVRDAILENCSEQLAAFENTEDSIQKLEQMIPEIEEITDQLLMEKGANYKCSAKICNMYFNQREYQEITLPAGYYDALRIELGEAGGKNWWCVMYPTICVSAADSSEIAESAYSPDEAEIVLGGQKYLIRFKTREIIMGIKNIFSE